MLDAHATVRAHRIGPSFQHGCSYGFWRRAHHGAVFVLARVEGERDDNGKASGFRRGHRQTGLCDVTHRLHQQRIRTRLG